ncbi:MAG: hypothetical protein ACP6IU_08580 [Candidatus Asgardarchaeia archaeon]
MYSMKKLLEKNGIVSDGDWDGVFGTGLLLQWAKSQNIHVANIVFPKPRDLQVSHFSEIVSLEIVPTKCPIERSIIFDHHEGPHTDKYYGNIWIFGKFLSVAELVQRLLDVEVPQKWIDAINEVDSTFPKSELGIFLFKAYQADVENFPRIELANKIAAQRYNELLDILKPLVDRYIEQEKIAEQLIESVEFLLPNVPYFIYSENQMGARRIAMFKLEEKYDIVIAIRMQENTIYASIATMKSNINLLPIFNELRNMGFSAGGHENVGGITVYKISLNKFLDILKGLIKRYIYHKMGTC